MNYGLTKGEQFLVRKSEVYFTPARLTFMFLMLILAAGTLSVDVFYLTPERLHAAEPEEIHQNDYYCRIWRASHQQVIGVGYAEVDELCKSLGL